MASQQNNLSQKVGEVAGQAQMVKDDYSNQAFQNSPSDQNASITSRATNIIQQTGVQVKSMAQGAADAVKHTLGMAENDNTTNPNTNTNTLDINRDLKNPSNTTSPSMPGHPNTRI